MEESLVKIQNQLDDIKDELDKFREQRENIEDIKEMLQAIIAHYSIEYHPR